MILGEQIYKLICQQLLANSITAYSDYIPDETSYPFCMYEIIDMEDSPDWSFKKDYERLTVRFNIYGNKDNPQDVVDLAEKIEKIFNRTKKTFIDTDNGKYLICNYKIDDKINILNDTLYWIASSDYQFIAQRNI